MLTDSRDYTGMLQTLCLSVSCRARLELLHIFCQLYSCFSFAYLHIVSTRNKAYLAAHKLDLVEASIIVPMLIYTVMADD